MKLTVLLCPMALLVSVQLIANPLPEEGRTIFMSRCAACHSVNKQLTGPALAGVYERRSTDWIVNFVQSSQTVIKRGDKDAVALFENSIRSPCPIIRILPAKIFRTLLNSSSWNPNLFR
jgi:hypothetical protein